MDFVLLRVINFDHPERIRAFFPGERVRKFNDLIFQDISVSGKLPFPDDFILGVFLQFGHKIDLLGGPAAKEPVVVIGPVIDHDGSGREEDLAGDLDIGHFPFGNPGKVREIAVMVQEQVNFDGAFGAAEVSPVKEADRQINHGRIQADQFILEAELFLAEAFALDAFQEEEKEFLIKLPGPMFVGIG